MKKTVIAAGHICLDITPVFPEMKVNSLDQILSPGKLLQMGKADVHTGGAVANTGLAMKKLGADVRLAGKIGKDAFGELILNILKKYDAQEGMTVSEGESTSYSVILAVPGIDRIFLHNPGANDSFCSDDIQDELLKDAVLFHFGYPPLMKSMYQNDGMELVKLLQKAKHAGAAVSLDMAAVDPGSEPGSADWKTILTRALPFVDFFMPSAEELCYMLDRERFYQWQERARGGREIFERSYIPERILSGTGAGDTSIAAFLTAVLKGFGPEECLHLAAAAGASCVAEYDALSGIGTLGELQEKINRGWEKYKGEKLCW